MNDKFLSIDIKIAEESLPFYQGLALLKMELKSLAEDANIPVQIIYKMYLHYREENSVKESLE